MLAPLRLFPAANRAVQPIVPADREFDLVQFAAYLRTHARWLIFACAIAVSVTAGISLVLPKKYTATSSVLIEPPAGNDPRAATALSPVYLDSLKTFERIASSDSLFAEALRRLDVPEAKSGRSMESLKRSILTVSKPGYTTLLEIGVTLKEPRRAQALAQYIAGRTVALSRSLDAASEDDVTAEARAILAAAETRLTHAQSARDTFTAAQPVQALEEELQNAGELQFWIGRDLADAEAELAGYTAAKDVRAEAARARVEQLKRKDADAALAITSKSALLERRKNERAALEAELTAAHAEYEAARNKLNDIRASALFRGERLQVIDPGVVPSRPSSPNLPLNVVAALVLSLIGGVFVLAFRYGTGRSVPEAKESAYSEVAAKW